MAAINRLAAASQKLKQNNNFSNFGSSTATSTTRAGGVDTQMRRAQAEIKNYQQQTVRGEKELTRQIEREARQQAKAKTNEMKRAADAMIREIKRVEAEERKASQTKPGGIGVGGAAFAGGVLGGAVGVAIGAITSAVTSGGAALLDYSSKIEQVKISFQTLTGSAAATDKLLKEIQDFAKSTPFEFAELAGLSQKLLGANVEASKVIPLIRDIGNAVSAVGGTQDDLNGVTRAITQIISLGRVQADELNQLSERNINGYKILATQLGKTEAETRKLIESGSISADVFLTAFQQFSQAKFGDAMQKQSQTFSGAMSNIKDSLLIAGSTYFKPLFDKISEISIATSKELENADFGQAVGILAKNIARGFGEVLAIELKKEWANIKWGEVLTIPTFNLGEELSKGLLGDWNLYDAITGDKKAFKGISTDIQKTIGDISKMNSTLNVTSKNVKAIPDLAKQLNAEKAKKDAEFLKNIITDLALEVRFFGDETKVAAVQQQLLKQGITDFSSAQAKTALAYAGTLDNLKKIKELQDKSTEEAKKQAEDYTNSLKDASKQLLEMRQDADFKMKFANPTELDEFNEQIRRGAFNFRELKYEIDATRTALKLLAQDRKYNDALNKSDTFIKDLKQSIESLNETKTTPFQDRIRELIQGVELFSASGERLNNADITKEIETRILNFQRQLGNLQSQFAAALVNTPDVDRSAIETRLQTTTQTIIDNWYANFIAYIRTIRQKVENGDKIDFVSFFEGTEGVEAFTGNIIKLFNAVSDASDTIRDSSFKELLSGLDEEIASLNRELAGGIELSRADALAKELQTEAYKNLTPEMQRAAIAKAQEIDALQASIKIQAEIRKEYEQTRETLIDVFDIISEEGKSISERLGNVFKYIADRFKRMVIEMAATAITNKIFGQQGGTQQSGGIGGILGNIFGQIFGGGRGGVSIPTANGSTLNFPSFNASGTTGAGGGFRPLHWTDDLKKYYQNQQSGGIGSIFGAQGFGANAGTFGALGAGASIVGGLVGGRVGGILSSVGSFASLGAAFGPWGAAIGAGVGLIAGLLGGDPKRKADKKQLPQLQQGFTDALTQLRQLLADVRSLRVEPESAISKADEIRTAIAQNFGLSWQSKKYRNQTAAQTKTRLAEADEIIKQIRQAAEVAKAAGERQRRILPEFAGGYFADFFKPNGLIPGTFDRKDDILAMISRGEMVLNPHQQHKIRQASGFDVFAHAQIPNYPARKNAVPQMATGGVYTGGGMRIKSDVNVKVELHNVEVKPDSYMILQTEDGKRKVIDIYKEAKKNREI